MAIKMEVMVVLACDGSALLVIEWRVKPFYSVTFQYHSQASLLHRNIASPQSTNCEDVFSHLLCIFILLCCYLGDMLGVDGVTDELWRPGFKLDGVNLGSLYHCLPIPIYHRL